MYCTLYTLYLVYLVMHLALYLLSAVSSAPRMDSLVVAFDLVSVFLEVWVQFGLLRMMRVLRIVRVVKIIRASRPLKSLLRAS